MQAKPEEFERFVNFQGPSIIALKGAINHKSMPRHYSVTDVNEFTDPMKISLHDIVGGKWKPMRKDVWSLPDAAEHGTIIPLHTGQQYIYIEGDWYFLASAQ